MTEGKLEPANFEDSPLPGVGAPDFDLSDENAVIDSNDVNSEQVPETGAQDEPEGIFALFDKEFPEETREPIEAEESSEFDREFSNDFEIMFAAVKGDGSAPLFGDQANVPEVKTDPVTTDRKENKLLPIPDAEPKRIEKLALEEDDDSLPIIRDVRTVKPAVIPSLDQYEDEEPLIDPSKPVNASLSIDPEPDEDEEPLSNEFLVLDDAPFSDLDPSPEDTQDDDNISEDLAPWSPEDESLEELSFDESDDDELYDELSTGDEDGSEFDEFAKMALGLDYENEDETLEDDEEDDFKVEELSGAEELDPFEDIAIMSSEDVAKFESPFGEEELKFEDEKPLPEDPDPFATEGEAKFVTPEDEYDPLKEIDPFSEEAAAMAEDAEKEAEALEPDEQKAPEKSKREDKPKREKKKSSAKLPTLGSLRGILLFPWRIYSTLTTILFGLIEGLIRILGGIPLIGIPFRLLGSVLSSIPMAVKRIVVLAVIASIAWGGTSLVSSVLPKPSANIVLPDSGSAKFTEVSLDNGTITGNIENTGDVNLLIFPQVKVFERSIINPGTWFSPTEKGDCIGELVEIAIDATAKVSYSCDITADGIISLDPSLSD